MSTEFKDHFSSNSAGYSRYRPSYPTPLYEYLTDITPSKQRAWDCATGSGQAAVALSPYFDSVLATDASPQQITHAVAKDNIHYSVATAEHSKLQDHSIDLIVVAQALHWFDLEAFTLEVNRVIKPKGILAAWSYNLLKINPHIDACINRLYSETLEGYWPSERAIIESRYSEISFPFQELETPTFKMQETWTLEQLTGYLRTWSAVKNYQKANNLNPIDQMTKELSAQWKNEHLHIQWPLCLRVWRV